MPDKLLLPGTAPNVPSLGRNRPRNAWETDVYKRQRMAGAGASFSPQRNSTGRLTVAMAEA